MIPKHYRIHAVLILSCLVMIFLPLVREKPGTEKAEKATAAAMEFLKLVDEGEYASSWQISADLLKKKVTQQDWVEQLAKIRSIAGPIVARNQKDISYANKAKDSPEGEYILLIFDSKYQAKESATEMVTVMLEEDSIWRVAGYFIK